MTRENILQQRIAVIDRAGNGLVDLVRPEFPKFIARSAPEFRPAYLGLVARATGTMETVLHVAELRREADLSILSRSLHEHATILGWLAADPEANYPLWKAEDARSRIKVHEEFGRELGVDLLTPEGLAIFEPLAAENYPGPTDLLGRARAADKYWKRRLGITDRNATFVGSYQIVFRWSSTRVHSTLQGLNDVIEVTPEHVAVSLESTMGNQVLASRAVVIYALALRVSAEVNGFPRIQEIDNVIADYQRGQAGLPVVQE